MINWTTSRVAVWLLNAGLLTLCCHLVAQIVNTVLAELLRPPPAMLLATPTAAATREPHSDGDHELILARNLFNASLLAQAGPVAPPEEELDETELPLGLLGTVSSSHADLASASVWDAETRKSLVVKTGDEVARGQATVVRIERRRVLLSENGTVRELVFDENGEYAPPKRPSPRRKRPNNNRRARRQGRR